MIYQVRANLFFTEHDEAVDFYYDCQLALAKSATLNPDKPHTELGIIELIENHHDESPNTECSYLDYATTLPS